MPWSVAAAFTGDIGIAFDTTTIIHAATGARLY